MRTPFARLEHRRIWRLAGPFILSNVSLAILGLVDTAVVGHLDAPYYLGGVAIATVVFDFLYWGMGFLRMGTTGIVARIHGAGDHDRMRSSLAQTLALGALVGAVILALQTPILEAALAVLHGSADVHHQARRYYDVAIWGAPAVMGILALLGWFVGMQNARAPLVILVTYNVVNVVLDLVLVLGIGMDVDGVALAAVAAQYTGVTLGLLLARRELVHYPGRWRRALITDLHAVRYMLMLNWNILLRTWSLIFAFAFFTSQSARQGDVVLAANAVLMKFQTFMALGLDGFAHAAEALTGRAIGAGDRRGFRDAVLTASVWAALLAGGYALVYALGGQALIRALTDLEPVRTAATAYLPWVVIGPLVGVWCFMLDGIFVGAARGSEMRNAMLLSAFGVYLPAWYLFHEIGNHGLWLAFTLFMAARGITLALVYRRIEARGGFVPAPTVAG